MTNALEITTPLWVAELCPYMVKNGIENWLYNIEGVKSAFHALPT